MGRVVSILAIVLLLSGALAQCAGSDSSDDVASIALISLLTSSSRVVARDQRSHRYLFVTTVGRNGNLGSVNGADAVCNASIPAALTGSLNYKALLVDGAVRIASATGDLGDGQADWVLEANREYRRADERSVFTANALRLFGFSGGGSLANSFSASAGAFWTGLNVDWTYVAIGAMACNTWTSANAGISGEVGAADQTGFAAIHDNAEACNRTTRFAGGATIGLLCIEQ